MLLVPTVLKMSKIHGIGVHAAAPIAKGAKLWEFHPGADPVFNETALAALPARMREFVQIYGYPHPTEKGTMLLDGDHCRFMNHSDTPNTDFRSLDSGYALADIAAGEEIVCDYHEFWPDGFVLS